MTASEKKRVLLVSHDVVGKKMAGAGIRYYQLAKVLARHFEVTLATPNHCDLPAEGFKLVRYTAADSFPKLIDRHDFIFVQLFEPSNILHAVKQGKVLIYDFYNLIAIEYLGSLRTADFDKAAADRLFGNLLEDYRLFFRTGKYFVCSNPRQADVVLGMLLLNQSIMPSTSATRRLEQIVGLLPFGLTAEPPKHIKPVLKGVVKGIDKEDFVIVWAGGIWDWFDPLSLITAMEQLKNRPDIKLVFLGTQHPNAEVGEMPIVGQAKALADEFGLLGKSVFFLEGWLGFDDRANYLLEADVAASIHLDTLETRYSFRTRILDHFWAGLPSIVTTGDWFADYIQSHDLGLVIGYQDVKAIATAIIKLKENPKLMRQIKDNIEQAANDFTWEKTASDLIMFIDEYQTADARRAELPIPGLEQENHHLRDELALLREKAGHFDAITKSRKWQLLTKLSRVKRGFK